MEKGTRQSLIDKIEELSDQISTQEEMINLILDHLPVVIWMTDPGMRLIYASPAFEHLWGIPREEAYSDRESWKKVVHPDDLKQVEMDIQKALKKKGDYALEQSYRIRRGGDWVQVSVRSFPVYDSRGNLIRIVGITRDLASDT